MENTSRWHQQPALLSTHQQRHPAQHGTARHSMAWHNMAWHSMAWHPTTPSKGSWGHASTLPKTKPCGDRPALAAHGMPDAQEMTENSACSPSESIWHRSKLQPKLSNRPTKQSGSTKADRPSHEAQSQRSHFQRREMKTPVICRGTQGACSRTSSLLLRSLITNSVLFDCYPFWDLSDLLTKTVLSPLIKGRGENLPLAANVRKKNSLQPRKPLL